MEALRSYLRTKNLTQADLAHRLGLKQPSVNRWFKRGRLPPDRVREVEAATGIPAEKLCPEIFRKLRRSS